MVSAVKMRKSVSSVLAIRPYAIAAWDVLTNLTRKVDILSHGLLDVREVKSVLIIMVTSNRGLCGSFNSRIMKKIEETLKNPKSLKINRAGGKKIESSVADKDLKIDFITIGRKGEGLARKLKKEIIATFPKLAYSPTITDIRPLSKIITREYLAKKYDKVAIAYVDYVSVVSQEPKIRQLLPISKVDLEKHIAEMDDSGNAPKLKESLAIYKIEQDPEKLLEDVVTRLIEMQIYHAILESNASKEASRMIAMKNATESAKEMVEDLSLAYNQIRQMKITQEIAEISAGRAALE